MARAKVKLLVDGSRDSSEAKNILSSEKIEFESIPASGANVPSARFAHGTYTGLSGIRLLARGLHEAQSD